MPLTRNLISNLTSNLTQNLTGDRTIGLPIVDSSLKFHVMSFGDGFSKEQLVTVDGSNFVASWNGISGTSNSATQSTQTEKPLFVDNAINSHPGITFDNVNDELSLDSQPIVGTSARTIFLVAQSDNTGLGSTMMSLTDDGDSFNRVYDMTGELAIRIDQGNIIYGNDNITTASIVTYTSLVGGTIVNTIAHKNGTLLTSTASTGGVTNVNTGTAKLGVGVTGINSYDGILGEVIIYDRVLSDAERQLVESYLSEKWDIVLT